LDVAGPIAAACASVEWLQLLISPEVCPQSEALLIGLERSPIHQRDWPRGLMAKALDFGFNSSSRDSRFDSWRGRFFALCANFLDREYHG
jgi:hypothetical protein